MGFLTWTDAHGVTHLYRTLPKELMDKIAEEARTTFKDVLPAMPEGNYIFIDVHGAEVKVPPASPNYALCGIVCPADMPFPSGAPTCLPCVAMNQFLEGNPWAKSNFV